MEESKGSAAEPLAPPIPKLSAKEIFLLQGDEMMDSNPERRPTKRVHKEPFNIHVFLREVKIVVVDLGGIAILAIWLWHEAASALVSK